MKPSDLTRAIQLAEAGRVELSPLIGARYALADGAQAFAALSKRQALKIVVEPQREAA